MAAPPFKPKCPKCNSNVSITRDRDSRWTRTQGDVILHCTTCGNQLFGAKAEEEIARQKLVFDKIQAAIPSTKVSAEVPLRFVIAERFQEERNSATLEADTYVRAAETSAVPVLDVRSVLRRDEDGDFLRLSNIVEIEVATLIRLRDEIARQPNRFEIRKRLEEIKKRSEALPGRIEAALKVAPSVDTLPAKKPLPKPLPPPVKATPPPTAQPKSLRERLDHINVGRKSLLVEPLPATFESVIEKMSPVPPTLQGAIVKVGDHPVGVLTSFEVSEHPRDLAKVREIGNLSKEIVFSGSRTYEATIESFEIAPEAEPPRDPSLCAWMGCGNPRREGSRHCSRKCQIQQARHNFMLRKKGLLPPVEATPPAPPKPRVRPPPKKRAPRARKPKAPKSKPPELFLKGRIIGAATGAIPTEDMERLTLVDLRKYATHVLKVPRASMIPGGRAVLIEICRERQKTLFGL